MSSHVESHIRRKVERPFGVYLITAFDFIAVGLVPLISTVLLNRMSEEEIPLAAFVLSVSLAVFAMAASVWALAGDNIGRWLLLMLVTISSLLLITNSLILMAGGVATGRYALMAVGAIIRGLFWVGINWWYFNRNRTVAYYKRNG
jgi:hypothetical protein